MKRVLLNIKKAILSFIVFSSFLSNASAEVSDDFFIYNKPQVPFENEIFFPALGSLDSFVMIEFFYNYDCTLCSKISETLSNRLEEKKDIRITFHPIPQNKKEYEVALLEHLSFTEGRGVFKTIHSNVMKNINLNEFSLQFTLQEIYAMDQHLGIRLFEKFQNEDKFRLGLDMSVEIAQKANVKKLPTLIINNNIIEIENEAALKRIEEIIILEKSKILQEQIQKTLE